MSAAPQPARPCAPDPLAGHPGGRALTAEALLRSGLRPPARVLDVGCGRGSAVAWLRGLGFAAAGLDLAAAPLAVASAAGCSALVRARGDALPVASGALDAVLLECSLSLAPDRGAVLAECARALAPGGRLLVGDLYARGPDAAGPDPDGPAFATEEALVEAVARQGLAVERFEDHSSALAAFVAGALLAPGAAAGDPLWRAVERGRRVRAGYCLLVAAKPRRRS